MKRELRFTFLCTQEEKDDLLMVARLMARSPSDAIRILVLEKKKELAEVKGEKNEPKPE